MALDGPISDVEKGGSEFEKRVYPVGFKIRITTDNGPKLFQCNKQHLAGNRYLDRLVSVGNWKIGKNYHGPTYGSESVYNAGDYLTVDVESFGDVILYNEKFYVAVVDFTSCWVFDNGNWDELDVIQWQPEIDILNGTLVYYNGYLYRCNENHTTGKLFLENQAFFPEFFNEISDPDYAEDSYEEPKNHFDLLLNELNLLDILYKTRNNLLDVGEQPFETVNTLRQSMLDKFKTQYNDTTGYLNQDYDYNIFSRPSYMSENERLDIITTIEEKINNNEIEIPSQLILKTVQRSIDHEYSSAESALSSFSSPESGTAKLRDTAQDMYTDQFEVRSMYNNTYEEIYLLIHGLLGSKNITHQNELSIARAWFPNHVYKQWDIISSPSLEGITLEEGELDVRTCNYGEFSSGLWLAKYDHISHLTFPDFQPETVKYEAYLHDNTSPPTATDFMYYHPCCNVYDNSKRCSSCDTNGVLGRKRAIWVKPIYTKKLELEYPESEEVPEPPFATGFVPLCPFHRNPANEDVKDNEAIKGIHKEEFNYANVKTIDFEGTQIPFTLAHYKRNVFKIIGDYITEPADELGEDELFNWSLKDIIDKEDVTISFVGIEGDPIVYNTLGLAFVTQMTVCDPVNKCCTGGNPTAIDAPEQISEGPEKYIHLLNICNDCGYVYDSWAGFICPQCLSTNTKDKGFEEGIINWYRACGTKEMWCDNAKQHMRFNTTLSPTNAKMKMPDPQYCIEEYGWSDCDEHYGCWVVDPEPMNIARFKEHLRTARLRVWIEWGYVDWEWICDYIGSNSVIWPGDHRADQGNPPTTEPAPEYLPPANDIPTDEWPNNWANAVDALHGDWPDKYAEPVSDSPLLGYIPKMYGPDGHSINDRGDYYGRKAEDFANFLFCGYVDNGPFVKTTEIIILRSRNDLQNGGNQYGDITMQRFALLNKRLRELHYAMSNTAISVGRREIRPILDGATIPNLLPDFQQQMKDKRQQKIEYTNYLRQFDITFN